MKYFYTALLTSLLILSLYLIFINNYFASLSLFILGILYVLMGWQQNAKFYFYIGLLILVTPKYAVNPVPPSAPK